MRVLAWYWMRGLLQHEKRMGMFGKQLKNSIYNYSIFIARLKLKSARKKRVSGLKETRNFFLLIVSLYSNF